MPIETITINAEQWAVVPREILDRLPELNVSNYDHEGVCALNAWGVELVLAEAQPDQAQQSDRMRSRFDEIEREICEGKHTAQSVFTQMRTAAIYLQQPTPRPEFSEQLEIKTLSTQLHAVTELLRAREREIAELKEPAPRPVPTIILGKGDKLVADIFQEDEDGILHMAGVGIFDPEPGEVYGIGARNEAIDGKAITEGNPLILIWSDKPESLQVIIDELQEAIDRLTGQQPVQRPVPTCEWQPIETAPDNKAFLACDAEDYTFIEMLSLQGDGVAWNYGSNNMQEIKHYTHWIPLPEPPTGLTRPAEPDGGAV